jgi:hypothetical protein
MRRSAPCPGFSAASRFAPTLSCGQVETRQVLEPRSADPDPATTGDIEELDGSDSKASRQPHKPMNGEVLQPALEPGEVTHADSKAGRESLLRPAFSVSQLRLGGVGARRVITARACPPSEDSSACISRCGGIAAPAQVAPICHLFAHDHDRHIILQFRVLRVSPDRGSLRAAVERKGVRRVPHQSERIGRTSPLQPEPGEGRTFDLRKFPRLSRPDGSIAKTPIPTAALRRSHLSQPARELNPERHRGTSCTTVDRSQPRIEPSELCPSFSEGSLPGPTCASSRT